jgi:peptidoglycan/xylan/chitin deacetylase (PgdA/CDA1 family)
MIDPGPSPLLMRGRARSAIALAMLASSLLASGCHGCGDEATPTPAVEKQSLPAAPEVIELAVTVDDLPVRIAAGTPETPPQEEAVIKAFLGAFAKQSVPAVYGFVNGQRVDEVAARLPLLEAWRNAGHPLGNHTHSHSKLNKLDDFLTDVDRGEDVLRRIYGSADERTWKVFRFPNLNEGKGAKRTQIRNHLDQRGYRVAPVSVDFFDYAYADAYKRCQERKDDVALARLEAETVEKAASCTLGSEQATRKSAGRPVKQVLLLHVGLLQAKVLERLLGELVKTAKVKFITLDQALEDPYLREHQRPDEESRRACGRAALGEIKKLCTAQPVEEQAEDRAND